MSIIPSVSQPLEILIVTGHSGAGKTTALRALEDVGYFCVDNLPIALFGSLYDHLLRSQEQGKRVALGIDVRAGQNMELLVSLVQHYQKESQCTIVFLTASPRILLRRFQETRRKHPLAEIGDISQAIDKEEALMRPLYAIAHTIIDTDTLTIHQLRNYVRATFEVGVPQKIAVHLISFGFKYGVPVETNFVYDVRSLPNPYFVPHLKSLKGTDEAILTYLFTDADVTEYWNKLLDFLSYSLEKSAQEGRSFIKIAIGCTGGRHRSVAFVHRLAQALADKAHIVVEHRDIARDTYQVR